MQHHHVYVRYAIRPAAARSLTHDTPSTSRRVHPCTPFRPLLPRDACDDRRRRVVGPVAAAGPSGPARGAHAAVLQLGPAPPDHRHRDVRRGTAGPRALLQAGRRQLRA